MAETLREQREELGLSIEAMAKQIPADEHGRHISAGSLSLYERGFRIPKPEQAERLGKGYGLPAEVVRYLCKQAQKRGNGRNVAMQVPQASADH